jgi:hypothetical protein
MSTAQSTAQSTTTSSARGAATPSPAAVDALTEALAAERKLIGELTDVMLRQRSAVGADDLQAVDDSVFATHRLLLTLGEARKRRRGINTLLGWREDAGVKQLEELLGDAMSPRLRTERDELQSAARELSREIEINRRVLREALANNEAFVRAMCGAPAEAAPSGYGGGAQTAYSRPDAIAITRTA